MKENPKPGPSMLGVNLDNGNSDAPQVSLSLQTDGITITPETSINSTSEVEALKLRIAELEMRTQNGGSKPTLGPNLAGPGVEQANANLKLMANLEQYKRMEECLYNHRKDWESGGGATGWYLHPDYSAAPTWRSEINQFGPWRSQWKMYSSRSYERPDPFDRYHVCETGGDKQKEKGYDEYDQAIDYGYHRERLRKNFEWDLDRLFLAEEMERRQQQAAIRKPKVADVSQVLKTNQSQGGDDGAVEETSVIFYAEPEIKRLGWSAFKQLANSLEKDAHAIDVLVEEPIIEESNVNQSLHWFDYQPHQHQKSDRLSGGKSAQAAGFGQLQLPERIRINSSILRKAMAKILGSDGQSLDETGEGSVSVIFTRPFKAITYSEPMLRKWHEDLEKKHKKISAPNNEELVTSDASLSTQQLPQVALLHSVSDEHEHRGNDLSSKSLIDTLNQELPNEVEQQKDEDKKEGNKQSDADSLAALSHLKCILNFIDSDILARKSALNRLETHKAFFSDLWHLFRPGTEVIESDGKQAYRVIRTSSSAHRFVNARSWWDNNSAQKQNTSFNLDCVYIDFDGSSLGPVYQDFSIKRFDGEKEITSFKVFPLRFYQTKRADFSDSEWGQVKDLPDDERFRQKLINRGLKFMTVIPMKHMYYSGLTLEARDEIESQVVIDFDIPSSLKDPEEDHMKSTSQIESTWRPKIASVISTLTDSPGRDSKGNLAQKPCHGPCCYGEFVFDDTFIDQKEATGYIESLVPKTRAIDDHPSLAIAPRLLKEVQADTDVGSMSNDELVIMSHRVFGFVLRSRKWGM